MTRKVVFIVFVIAGILYMLTLAVNFVQASPGCHMPSGAWCLWPFSCQPFGSCSSTPNSCSTGAWECGCCTGPPGDYIVCRCR